jgi:flavin reductase (DIM6/NTAB) family NADH-FMN oxidoreductase RutF
MKSLVERNLESLKENPFTLIGKEWMLITAGTKESFNTMTAAWGGLGVLWGKNVSFCFIRPGRHTFGFMEKSGVYTLSFFEEQYRDALNYCGTKSGRDVDKVSGSGLAPVFDNESIYFAEARLVMVCRKLYFQDIAPDNFQDPSIFNSYPNKDYHRMYVGEVVKYLAK